MALVPAEADQTASIADVERVVNILKQKGELSAAEIAERLGLGVTENTKRKVRAIARAARPGIVSFPNSRGYKLASACTLDELHACIASWDSVIRDATATKKLFIDLLHGRSGGRS